MKINRKLKNMLIVILIIIFLIIFYATNLTYAYINILVKTKGDDLTWSDFKTFHYTSIGSGMYVYEYKIIGGGTLIIGGPSLDSEPWYIEVISPDGSVKKIKEH